MIEILKAIILGIVEGITEWLPISSTGHIILVDEFLKMNVSEQFMSMFTVVIQLGAILAVVVIYWNKIFPFRKKEGKILVNKNKIIMWIKIVIACLPAALIIPFDDKFEELFHKPIPIALALIIVGVLFILVENRNTEKTAKINSINDITYKAAIIIGVFQMIAGIFPGVSRSGATILGGISIGLSRTIAAEFTFFLAIPVMFGASFIKLLKFGFAFTGFEITLLLVASLVSFIVSIATIKFLISYVKKHDFKIFGWYRIALGILVILYFTVLQ
ncbi:undecaprenyl-diphosphate phosphatase [Miniphocaeibacter halophilus]|uniref:Undecaprenyl-diphosphate phosphatase n=1 Tax=Miniphocaeibacter halophilus TaxID=2931922 RepID=A0AC61MPH1_9FIRM|nr:undecaprenyl-diphosphate phosphatase [Miniphocaeibacter halophilus]QQK07447.1 undecaprenyl-diphosphate phosphatase [Miniphocaeibacter halophilus]